MSATATYVACLTPPGTGAIATIGVRGPAAFRMVDSLIVAGHPSLALQASIRALKPEAQAKEAPLASAENTFRHARLGEDLGEHAVITAIQTNGVQEVEIHCHG